MLSSVLAKYIVKAVAVTTVAYIDSAVSKILENVVSAAQRASLI